MKFAREVIDLMGAYPGKPFRMQQLVRFVDASKVGNKANRDATRKAIARVLSELANAGYVIMLGADKKGSFATYQWKHHH